MNSTDMIPNHVDAPELKHWQKFNKKASTRGANSVKVKYVLCASENNKHENSFT